MTRFFQIFAIIALYLFFIYLVYKKESSTKIFLTSILFFLIPVIPYLIFNIVVYQNPFHGFLLQAWMTKFTGWIFHESFSFYFLNLIKENVLILFSILGIFFIFKNEKKIKYIIPFVFLFVFIFYNITKHKEMRLLLNIFPFLYILTSYGLISFSNLFKKQRNMLLTILVSIGLILIIPNLSLNNYDDKLDNFNNFDQNYQKIWISNPAFIVKTDLKADELIYFPLYNSEKIKTLKGKVDEVDSILINTCDILPCPPSDSSCNQEHDDFINLLEENFNLHLNEKKGECEYYIFVK